MTLKEVKTRAKGMGLKTSGGRKGDLVRAIQKKEGNVACFESGTDECNQFGCCWRPDCLPEKKSKKSTSQG